MSHNAALVGLALTALAGWAAALAAGRALLFSGQVLARVLLAVRVHHEARGHDRCWELDAALYRAAGLEPGNEQLPPREEFRAGCLRYEAERYGSDDGGDDFAQVAGAWSTR